MFIITIVDYQVKYMKIAVLCMLVLIYLYKHGDSLMEITPILLNSQVFLDLMPGGWHYNY